MPETSVTPMITFRAAGVVSQEPLLATKLFVPQAHTRLVARPQLTQRLNQAVSGKLLLIAAPAGFGKTMLVSEWIVGNHHPTAWVTLDAGDNDPARFLTYLIAALQMIEPDLGQTTLSLLGAPQSPSDQAVLTTLLNEIAAIPHEFVLVLDDYHLIETERIHEALAFFLEHLPPQVMLVIASRSDPPLPLARLRVRGDLTEIRAADLRFSPEEVATFLNDVMGLSLSPTDVAALESRTEGWIAGLQLAALSMQGRADIQTFIDAFTGDNRYVLDYLAEEVLLRQPEDVQEFLLSTALLNRLTGDLCNAVTGRDDSQDVLESLESANLFIIPLDDKRRWYRYHQLFGDFLRERLHQVGPEQIARLHRLAADWYHRHNIPMEAIHHALASGDSEHAADLIEEIGRTMQMNGEITTLQNWTDALPNELLEARPRLCLIRAWALVASNQEDEAEAWLKIAELALGVSEDTSSTVLRRSTFALDDVDKIDEILGEVFALRTMIALDNRTEASEIIRLSELALETLPESSLFLRGVVTHNLGVALWFNRDLDRALETLNESARLNEAAGNTYLAIAAQGNLGELHRKRGELQQSYDHYEYLEQITSSTKGRLSPFAGWPDIGMGLVLYYWNELDSAAEHLIRGIELIEQDESADRTFAGLGQIGLALTKYAQGDKETAFALLEDVEQVARSYGATRRLKEINYIRALWRLISGDIETARRLMQGHKPRPTDQLDQDQLADQMMLAWVYLADGRADEAVAMLLNLNQVVEAGGMVESRLIVLSRLALGYQAQGNLEAALSTLAEALEIAAPSGQIRVFVDHGPAMAELLQQATSHGIMPDYVNRLLAAYGEPSRPIMPAEQPLVEPLSEREMDVLYRIAEGYSNREIADHLYVAISTVKTHINNIYGKLGVRSRTQAIARARDLNLLS